MKKSILKKELMRMKADVDATIRLLSATNRSQAAIVHDVLTEHEPAMGRRIARLLKSLERRSAQGTGKSSNPQVPPVRPPVNPPVNPLLEFARVDWLRLRRDIASGRLSYGKIARAVGKGTKWRGVAHHIVNGKYLSGPNFNLVAAWATQQGYVKPNPSTKHGGHKS